VLLLASKNHRFRNPRRDIPLWVTSPAPSVTIVVALKFFK
jgi:hypothetical protein